MIIKLTFLKFSSNFVETINLQELLNLMNLIFSFKHVTSFKLSNFERSIVPLYPENETSKVSINLTFADSKASIKSVSIGIPFKTKFDNSFVDSMKDTSLFKQSSFSVSFPETGDSIINF